MTTPLDLIPAPVRDILVAHAHITGTLTLSLALMEPRGVKGIAIGRDGVVSNARWEVQRRDPSRSVDLMGISTYGDTVQEALLAALQGIRDERLRAAEWHRGESKRLRLPERKQQQTEWAAKAEADAATLSDVIALVTAAWPMTAAVPS